MLKTPEEVAPYHQRVAKSMGMSQRRMKMMTTMRILHHRQKTRTQMSGRIVSLTAAMSAKIELENYKDYLFFKF